MRTISPWKSYARGSCIPAICLLVLTAAPLRTHAQCTAAPIAASACSGGNGAVTEGVNINSGNTYWVSGNSTFSNVNLNGGTLHVCGNLTLSTLSFNSGTVIVENGGTLGISALSSPYLNGNTLIINRGVINISGNITFQNANNAVYNELSTSTFNVAGTVTVNSSSTTISNNGTMSLSGLYYQGMAGGFCVGPESLTYFYDLTNITTNGFNYSGSGAPACVNVTNSATLPDALTNSSFIHVCQGFSGAPSGSGGWGSATVTTNCNSCASVLPLGIENFTATAQGRSVDLRWEAGPGPGDNGTFYAEKSTDGIHFEAFGEIAAVADQADYTMSDPDITAPKLYYRIRTVNAAGVTMYSTVALVESAATGGLQIFPNPAGPNTAVNLVISAPVSGSALISLLDMTGAVLDTKAATLTAGSNTISWDLPALAAGVYLVRIKITGSDLYGRLVVRP